MVKDPAARGGTPREPAENPAGPPQAQTPTGNPTGAPEEAADPHVTDVDAAVVMLNRMRQNAAARGEVRQTASRQRKDAAKKSFANPAQYSGGRDPQGVGLVFNRMVAERGWTSPVAVGSVISRWEELVGGDIGAHCQPESFQDTTVQVRCDSTAWATQLRLLSATLLKRFEAELGAGVVTKIDVLGPAAPNWRKGYRTVKGRGPRDTYG